VCFTEEAPFEFKKLLSHKNSSRVTVVTVLVSHKEYTRKNISRKSRQDYKRYIEKLEIWKKVRHRHLVTLVGSYLDNRSFGFIMSPVAEMNLESFLELAPSSAEKGTLLRQFFGCLACALKFLHENNIRHGNIRPSNILVHGENVLFTDVGFNRPNQENSGSTTTGAEPAFDLYSSPEQQNEFRQSFSSDIWSLGWVFLDMETVLKGERTEKMHSFMLGGRSNWNVLQNLNKVQKWTVELKKRGNLDDNAPFEWVMGMLKPNDRPEAKKLVNEILKLSTISNSPTFCGACCIENKKFP
jgi:serine/threonine protein kinase